MEEIPEALSRILQKVNTRDLSQNRQTFQEKSTKQGSYKCPICQDTGFIYNKETDTYRQCKHVALEVTKSKWRKLGIDPEKSNQTFSNFKVWNETSKTSKAAAIKYYNEFKEIKDTRKNSIMFCGQVGSGKTHLSIALALNFIKKGINVVYMPYRDVVTRIKQNMLDKEYYKKQLSKFQLADILLIDDLFKGKVNETDINIMFEVVNYRYLNYLPLIVSSEFTLDKMLNFDEGVGSRIYEMCKGHIVQIEGKENNYRLKE